MKIRAESVQMSLTMEKINVSFRGCIEEVDLHPGFTFADVRQLLAKRACIQHEQDISIEDKVNLSSLSFSLSSPVFLSTG